MELIYLTRCSFLVRQLAKWSLLREPGAQTAKALLVGFALAYATFAGLVQHFIVVASC